MKTNEELQRDVQFAIKWEPFLNAAEIGVTVKDGVVTLSGTVDSYSKKIGIEKATKNVLGVKAIAENIKVEISSTFKKNDTEIATEIVNAWKWRMGLSSDNIKVKVENGWVTLSGEVEWFYQKNTAEKSVRSLMGVTGVTNNISIKANNDKVEKEAIERSILRNWSVNDEDIKVSVTGNKVKLTGSVESLYQRELAGRLAWNAPGVNSVENDLVIEYIY